MRCDFRGMGYNRANGTRVVSLPVFRHLHRMVLKAKTNLNPWEDIMFTTLPLEYLA